MFNKYINLVIKYSAVVLSLGMCSIVYAEKNSNTQTKPIPLDWRSISWPELNYSREPIEGGASLYLIPNKSAQKFRITLMFNNGYYVFPQSEIPNLDAAGAMLLQGGFGNKSFEEIDYILSNNALSIKTNFDRNGRFFINLEGLGEDLPLALNMLEEIIFQPMYSSSALKTYLSEAKSNFTRQMEGGNTSAQNMFVLQQINKYVFGEKHYFASTVELMNPKSIENLDANKIKNLMNSVINKLNLNVVLVGTFSNEGKEKLKSIIERIPKKSPLPEVWLPERSAINPSKKTKVVIIRKKDMKQINAIYRIIVPRMGELNQLEKTQMTILKDVFSSQLGIIGTDRWSKAMRADSGFSYSAHASFLPLAVYPNTNNSIFQMVYQNPSNKVLEAAELAKKTWFNFLDKGISESEFSSTRVGLMNSMLAEEKTIFERSDEFIYSLQRNKIPSTTSDESELARLENEKDFRALNASFKYLFSSESIGVIGLIGNPEQKSIDQLKKSGNFEIIKDIDFSELVKYYIGK